MVFFIPPLLFFLSTRKYRVEGTVAYKIEAQKRGEIINFLLKNDFHSSILVGYYFVVDFISWKSYPLFCSTWLFPLADVPLSFWFQSFDRTQNSRGLHNGIVFPVKWIVLNSTKTNDIFNFVQAFSSSIPPFWVAPRYWIRFAFISKSFSTVFCPLFSSYRPAAQFWRFYFLHFRRVHPRTCYFMSYSRISEWAENLFYGVC